MTLSVRLKTFIQHTFDIREGEYYRVALMQLNIFLIISTLLVIKPTVNGLFMAEIGVEALPKAFLLVAIFAAIVSTLYARLLLRINLNRLMIGTLVISVICLLVFGLLLRFNFSSHIVLYVFYVWSAIFAVLAASQFWILANMVFNAREAKRLFGFIGTGAIVGGIFGGYLTSVLASFFDSEYLLFVGAGMLVFCIPITQHIWKRYVQPNLTVYERKKKKTVVVGEHPFQLIKKSKHLTFLASIIGISVIVAKLVDYQFSAIAAEKISDPDELTAFFGFWFSNFNILSLLIQVFLTRRVVGKLGVGKSLFFLPISILVGAFSLLFIPELWAAILLKASDAGLKQSVNKSSVELLALPIPIEVKNQTKTFIDVFIDSIATGVGGLLLIFVLNGLELSTSAVSLMIIGFILLWLFFIKKIQKEYLRSFKLKITKIDENETPADFGFTSSNSVLESIQKVLTTGTTAQILYALKKAKPLKAERLFEVVHPLLKYPDGAVRAAALDTLYFLKKNRITQEVESLIKDPDQNVKIRAFEYLIEHSPENLIVLMNQYLNDSDESISSAALISLAIETRDNPVLKEQFQLENRIEKILTRLYTLEDGEQRKFNKLTILKAIGHASIPNQILIIEQFFKDTDVAVKNQAILAAGQTLNSKFITTLVEFLGQVPFKENAATALFNYGSTILPVLFDIAQDSDTEKYVLYHIPFVVQRFGKQTAVDMLFQLMDMANSSVRLSALRALNEMKTNFPFLDFRNNKVIPEILEEARLFQQTLSVFYVQSKANNPKHTSDKMEEIAAIRKLLIQLIEQKLDRNLERIFRLLGLKYAPQDVLSIYESIQSQQEDLRINAIEFLDNLLEPSLKKILMPIAETTLLNPVTEEAIRNLEVVIPSEYDCFKLLLEGQNPEIRLMVGRLIRLLDKQQYLDLLKPAVSE